MTATTGSTADVDRRSLRRLMAAGMIGSSIEWYDFFIYATAAALVFGPVFFPNASPLVGTLLSFSTFWAGFVARPVGGLIFGHFGDKIGRKPALVTCLVMMGSSTFLIGLLPTADTVGVLAPVLLVALRFMQGIAVGGQWGGITLLLTENADKDSRGKAGTFGQMGVPMGVLLGNIAFIVTGDAMSDASFAAWGWRIPFLLSALLLPVVLFIQLRVEDTPVFRELKSKADERKKAVAQAPLSEVLRTRKKEILLGCGLLFSCNAIFYISIAGVLEYGTSELGMDNNALLMVTSASAVVSLGMTFVAGRLSDRFGRKPLLYAGAGLITLWGFPFFWLIDTASLPLVAIAVIVGGIGTSLVYGPLAAVLAELFEPRVRYSGASMAYQLAAIVVSGGTPFLMTALLAATGTSASVSVYIVFTGLVTIGCTRAVRETRKAAFTESERAEEAQLEAV